MAKQTSLFLPNTSNTNSVTFTSADTTTDKLIFTAGTNGSDVDSIVAATTDSANVNLLLYVTRSAVNYLLGTVNIPITAGTTGAISSIDILSAVLIPGLPVNSVGKQFIRLASGDTLRAACLATMTATKTTYVSVFGQDY